jgi:hypothetical protein
VESAIYSFRILIKLKDLDIFSTNIYLLSPMKILPVGDQLYHAEERKKDRRTNIHDEANSRFSQFCEKRAKTLLRT